MNIIDSFAEQVLAETPLLSFQHVRKGFQRTVAGTRDGATMASIVQQGVNGFLQHALLIADDDFRGMKLQEIAETIVAVDDTAIQVIQVAGRETAAFQRDQRTQLRRNDRQNAQDHPTRIHVVVEESFDQPHTLGDLLADRLAGGGVQVALQLFLQFLQIQLAKKLLDGFSTHAGLEVITICLAVFIVLLVRQNLFLLQRRVAGLRHDPAFIVQNTFQALRCQIENQAQTARKTFVEPYMRHRHRQVEMPHAFTADTRFADFHAAFVTDNTLVLLALVLSACALPVPRGAENPFAEQTALFRFESTVIDGFGILDFAAAPRTDCLRTGHADRHETAAFH